VGPRIFEYYYLTLFKDHSGVYVAYTLHKCGKLLLPILGNKKVRVLGNAMAYCTEFRENWLTLSEVERDTQRHVHSNTGTQHDDLTRLFQNGKLANKFYHSSDTLS
jgi:hypothetical protein